MSNYSVVALLSTRTKIAFILTIVLVRQVGVQPPFPPGSGAAGRSPAA